MQGHLQKLQDDPANLLGFVRTGTPHQPGIPRVIGNSVTRSPLRNHRELHETDLPFTRGLNRHCSGRQWIHKTVDGNGGD
jgi:hypothetical protein